jgi:hypothetical protein
MDPDPKKVVAGYPTVVHWAETRARQWSGDGAPVSFEHPTPFARHILAEMPVTYSPFVLANRDAQAAGAKALQVETYGEQVSYLSRPYPEMSRQMVIEHIRNLAEVDRDQVTTWLQSVGLHNTFSP